jgi:hypothetical protein
MSAGGVRERDVEGVVLEGQLGSACGYALNRGELAREVRQRHVADRRDLIRPWPAATGGRAPDRARLPPDVLDRIELEPVREAVTSVLERRIPQA